MAKATLESLLEQVLKGNLLSAHLNGLKEKKSEQAMKMAIRPIMAKQKKLYQCSFFYQSRVIHQNETPEEAARLIKSNLETTYKQGIFLTQDSEFHVLSNERRQITCLKKPARKTLSIPMHNRKKNYVLEEGEPIPFLVHLGIMTTEGKIIAKKYDKFRQINRFLEMVRDVAGHLPKGRRLEIIDFGCGKAYLTFALYHYLHHVQGLDIHLIGLDLKQDIIDFCQNLAKQMGFVDLHFEVGDINQYEAQKKVDMVITLHACDKATDAALNKAVDWEAQVILCVPCCQHELFSQIDNKDLTSLLRHGILKERFSALVTDAARAELLTMLGYDVQILEFIDLEHTPKNLLIRAVKNQQIKPDKKKSAYERYSKFSRTLQINPSIWSFKLESINDLNDN